MTFLFVRCSKKTSLPQLFDGAAKLIQDGRIMIINDKLQLILHYNIDPARAPIGPKPMFYQSLIFSLRSLSKIRTRHWLKLIT